MTSTKTMSAPPAKIRIDIVSDGVCPWCIIGYKQLQEARDRLTGIGDSLDFPFNFYEGQRIYNTFLAHQLLTWAGQHGKQSELQMASFESPPTCCNL